jgi:SAM-dependent methyltransferase
MADSWDAIADWYAALVRAGSAMHDFARDAVLDCLPGDLEGQRVVDLGCGEGLLTRAVAERGASVVGVDPSPRMIGHARAAEDARPTGAVYAVDDGCVLDTVGTDCVDWVIAGLSLNNVPDLLAAVRAMCRVLVVEGRLVFIVPHPCFEAPHATWADGEDGVGRRVVGDYLAEGFWRSTNPQGVRRAGNQHRMISTYVRVLIAQGFMIEVMKEPVPDARVAAQQPQRAGLPPFLLVRARLVEDQRSS